MTEEWRDIPGFEGLYRISSSGQVWSIRNNQPKKPYASHNGYLSVKLNRDGHAASHRINRLVLECFDGPVFHFMEAHHDNHNKKDNSYTNLKWTTRQENIDEAKKAGRFRFNGGPRPPRGPNKVKLRKAI